MSDIERAKVSIQQMTIAHVDQTLALCREAGWNQLSEDWQRLIRYEPSGCFVAMSHERVVASVTTTRYGRELGWIGMMLVHPDFRRLGIATALMQRSIRYLTGRQTRRIKLDATPAGKTVYEKMGFGSEWSFHRWSREGAAVSEGAAGAGVGAEHSDWAGRLPGSILKLDTEAFGADRGEWLSLLADGSFVQVDQAGFGMLRPGFLASYLGPVAAKTVSAAESIVARLCERTGRTIFWDIPSPNRHATEIAQTLGFQPVRDLTRMGLGTEGSRPNLNLQYALADPGTG